MKNSNMRESPIARDTLLITDAEYVVKQKVPKILLECFMRQLQNELIASPYDGGLLVDIHANKNDLIISDTMLYSLAPPKLRPMTYLHKIMRVSAIYNTSNYFQQSLNSWRRKQLKIMKDKADNSRVREKDELTQSYKSYSDYAFSNDKNHHPRCRNAADSVLCTPTTD